MSGVIGNLAIFCTGQSLWRYLPFCWFLWLFSCHHQTKIISTLCSICCLLNPCGRIKLSRRLLLGIGTSAFVLRNTGETPASFLTLATDVCNAKSFSLNIGCPRNRQRPHKFNIVNQILLVMMWLRKYPHVDSLALWFDIDPTSVNRVLYKTLQELWR